MYLYAGFAAIVAVVAGIIIAARAKRADDVVYGKLDKAGRITNILLIPVYSFLTLFFVALSVFISPAYGGFLGILGWIVAIIISSVPLYCGFALSASVVFRKKGKSKLSFAVQFAGFAGAALALILFSAFYGNLLRSLN